MSRVERAELDRCVCAVLDMFEGQPGQAAIPPMLSILAETIGFQRGYLFRSVWTDASEEGEPCFECIALHEQPGYEVNTMAQAPPHWFGRLSELELHGAWAALGQGESFCPSLPEAGPIATLASERTTRLFGLWPLRWGDKTRGILSLSFCHRDTPLSRDEQECIARVMRLCAMHLHQSVGEGLFPRNITPLSVSTCVELEVAASAEGEVLSLSEGAPQWWGCEARELINNPISSLVTWPQPWSTLLAHLRAGERVQCTARIPRPIGGPLGVSATMHLRAYPTPSVSVKLDALASMRSATAIIASTERQLHRILRGMSVVAWEWTAESGALSWTEPLHVPSRILRRAQVADDALERLWPMVHQGSRKRLAVEITQALHDPTCDNLTVKCRLGPDAGLTWVSLQLHIERDVRGRPARVYGLASDVSNQHALEEHVLALQKVENMGFLARTAVHDLSNLLAAASTTAELLEMGSPDDPSFQEDIGVVVETTRQASDVIRSFWAATRTTAQGDAVSALNGLLNAHRPVFQRILGGRVRLVTDLCDEPCPVNLSATKLERIILNLLINAREAIDSAGGEGEVTITTRVVAHSTRFAGRSVVWVVQDNGPGFGAEVARELFSPTFTTKPHGHGIGLASCQRIVKRHRGVIRAESEEGMGARFFIELPLVEEPEEPSSSQVPMICRLLIDEPITLNATALALRTSGCQVSFAVLGDEPSQEPHEFLVIAGWGDGRTIPGWRGPIMSIDTGGLMLLKPGENIQLSHELMAELRAAWASADELNASAE